MLLAVDQDPVSTTCFRLNWVFSVIAFKQKITKETNIMPFKTSANSDALMFSRVISLVGFISNSLNRNFAKTSGENAQDLTRVF